jgi:hypothetical protein
MQTDKDQFPYGRETFAVVRVRENVTIDSESEDIFCRLRHLIGELGTKILASIISP